MECPECLGGFAGSGGRRPEDLALGRDLSSALAGEGVLSALVRSSSESV